MMYAIGVLLGIIILLILTGYVMMDRLEYEKNKNKEYFTKLRRNFDVQIEELKKDIAVRDEIIDAYRGSMTRGEIKNAS